MKKFIALLLSVLMVLSLVACGTKDTSGDADKTPKTDMEYVKDKGTLIVGITDFAPMDYKDDKGEWIGFDADMAKAFAKYLGVDVEFKVIVWKNKLLELDGKTVDCIWNGMTLTDELKDAMSCADPYCKNAQVVVVKKDVADQYQTEESLKNLKFAVEKGSAGKDVAESLGVKPIEVDAQSNAVMEVNSGTADAAIIDLLMAGAMIGEGTGYPDLTYTVQFGSEEYGVGFRKNSELAEEWNKFWKEAYADGSVMECAKTYGVQESIIKPE